MSVRQSLLAILTQGPSYGYQLRQEFDRRTGGVWPLNVGQVYSTLDRLERDALVVRTGTEVEGQIYFEITDAGKEEVELWLSAPVQRSATTRDELSVKLALAASLPGADVTRIIGEQRMATLKVLQDLTRSKRTPSSDAGINDLTWALVLESMIMTAETEIRWLDYCEESITRARETGLAEPTGLAPQVPRGRPSTSRETSTARRSSRR